MLHLPRQGAQADIDDGYVLTCQAHPLTERVVISFDER